MSTRENNHEITIGRIISAFGIRGWVELVSFTEPESNLFKFSPWHLSHEQKPLNQTVNVIAHKPHKQKAGQSYWVAQLAECTDRDQALALRGAYIKISRNELPPLAQNEFYWTDLEGLAIYNLENQLLGQVDYLFATGANDVLVIKNANKTLYIPYILGKFVKEIHLEKQMMIVDWEED